MTKKDAYLIMLDELSTGPKTPKELREACKKEGVSDSTYHYHLKQLVEKLHEVEEISEKDSKGRLVKKYALKQSPLLKEGESNPEEVPLSRRLLEMAAWLKLEPDGWPPFEIARKARILVKNYEYIIPLIEPSHEDPDRFAYVWSDEPCNGQRRGEFIQSRFFKLKDVYGAVVQADESKLLMDCDVFVGAFGSDVVAEKFVTFGDMYTQIQLKCTPMELVVDDEPFSVCIAVCRKNNGALCVVHVEGKEGTLDETWVRGISKQLHAKTERALTFEAIEEDVKRDVLMKLRDVLEKHLLVIPNRYVRLVEDLLDFSYGELSSGYVLALALALDVACTQSKK